MTYAVLGITGNTGGRAAEALLEAGASVRALVRSPGKAAAWAERGVEVVAADLGDRAALTAGLEGTEGAFVLLPPQWGAENVFDALAPLIANLLAAIEAADAPRVVVLSSVGAHVPEGTGPIVSLRPLEAGLAGREGVTFLRAAYFQENLGASIETARSEGVFYAGFDPERPIDMVATADIGREAARLLLAAEPGPAVVNLAGPQPRTLREAATALGAALGQTLDVVRIPADGVVEPLRAMGAGHLAELYGEMNAALDAGLVAFEASQAVTRGPTDLETTLAALAG